MIFQKVVTLIRSYSDFRWHPIHLEFVWVCNLPKALKWGRGTPHHLCLFRCSAEFQARCLSANVCFAEIWVPGLERTSPAEAYDTPSHCKAWQRQWASCCDFTDAGKPVVPSCRTLPTPCTQKPSPNVRASLWPRGFSDCNMSDRQGHFSWWAWKLILELFRNDFAQNCLPGRRKNDSSQHFFLLSLHLAEGYSPCQNACRAGGMDTLYCYLLPVRASTLLRVGISMGEPETALRLWGGGWEK